MRTTTQRPGIRTAVAGILAAAFVAACAQTGTPGSKEDTAAPNLLHAAPRLLVAVQPEIPAGVLGDQQSISFDIEFDVAANGDVRNSRIVAVEGSAPESLQQALLESQRTWLYSTIDRPDRPCSWRAFRARQRLTLWRATAAPRLDLGPLEVLERSGPAYDVDLRASRSRFIKRAAPVPRYPEAALRARIEGDVVTIIRFGADGVPTDVFLSSSRPGVFDASVDRAARGYRIEPPGDGDRAVLACVHFKFQLR